MGPLRPHRPSEKVAGYLARGEIVAFEMKQHWARILPAVACCVLGLVFVLAAGFLAPAWMGPVTNAAWWIWLVLLAHLAFRVLQWWDETFVITNRRLILVHGLVVKKVAMMPLSKVTDMSYNRSPAARILGYGTFVLESAGQEQALDIIDFVRDPDAKYRDICSLIFGEPDEDAPPPRQARGVAGTAEDVDVIANTDDADRSSERPAPRAWRGRRAASDDDTDPYGLVTTGPPLWGSDPGHTYRGERDVGETPDLRNPLSPCRI